jgi:WD40 repeat protein
MCRCMLIFKAHAKPITAVAFSPDGTLLATASGTERLVRLWQLGTDKPKKLHEWPMHFPSSVAFSPDSQIVVAGSLGALGAWQPDGTAVIDEKVGAPKLCVSARGVLYAHGMVSTRRWTLPAGTPLPGEWAGETAEDLNHGCGPIACTTDGARVAAHFAPKTGPDSRFVVRDAASGEIVARFDREKVSVQPVRARFSHANELFATSFGPEIVVWNVKTQTITTTLSVGKKHVPDVAFTSLGACLVATSNDATVRRWDTKTWKEKPVYEWDVGKLAALDVSADECRIASGGATGKIIIWDVAD